MVSVETYFARWITLSCLKKSRYIPSIARRVRLSWPRSSAQGSLPPWLKNFNFSKRSNRRTLFSPRTKNRTQGAHQILCCRFCLQRGVGRDTPQLNNSMFSHFWPENTIPPFKNILWPSFLTVEFATNCSAKIWSEKLKDQVCKIVSDSFSYFLF